MHHEYKVVVILRNASVRIALFCCHCHLLFDRAGIMRGEPGRCIPVATVIATFTITTQVVTPVGHTCRRCCNDP